MSRSRSGSLRKATRLRSPEIARIRDFLLRVGGLRVPHPYRGFRWLAAAALLLFGIECVTGTLLALYYQPDPGAAWTSTREIAGTVPIGWAVRGIHLWAGELLLLAVTVHLCVIFFRRAFESPRQYEWVIGVLLLMAMILFRFTGRMLPTDTVGYLATREGLDMLSAIPLIGRPAARWLQGGADFGANALSRFYITHILLLPWLTALLAVANVALVLRHDRATRKEDA
ncbi:MAG: cytochrome b N-terminal domain-containing protein [Planctomycetota bacterium]